MKKLLKAISPPFIYDFFSKISKKFKRNTFFYTNKVQKQDLNIYWTKNMSDQLEGWGKDHTWNKIGCLLINCKGKVLDIVCGTCVNIMALSRFDFLDIYGFDISDHLIQIAKKKGILPDHLKIMDATKTEYLDNEFDYSYSIGSLEHFTEDGINDFLKDCSRYTKYSSFHMIPVSENNLNNGWLKKDQSYYNNSVEWWLEKFQKDFKNVSVLNSGWKDLGFSLGKWFICEK